MRDRPVTPKGSMSECYKPRGSFADLSAVRCNRAKSARIRSMIDVQGGKQSCGDAASRPQKFEYQSFVPVAAKTWQPFDATVDLSLLTRMVD